ncbi:MAG TPA: sugar ABC transporter permease [Xanthobacteraceae bacterium]|nr:sugar ABC transporter permease [Xanthobacteraceae bacterium]
MMVTAAETAASVRAWPLARSLNRLAPYLYVLPAVAALALWNYYPLLFLVDLSFHRLDASSPVPSWVGLTNYRDLLGDPLFWRVLLNTAIYTFLAVPLSIALGLALAVVLNQRLLGARLFRTLFYTPVVLPTVAAATIALWIFNSNYGLANYLLQLVGQPPVEWLTNSSYALWTVIAIGVWKTFGYFMLVYLAALQALPQAVLEAARLDGARPWDRFWSITWPLLRPTTWFATVIALILSFQAFDFVNIMTQGGPSNATNLLVFYIYQHGFQYFELGFAAASAVVMFALVYALSALVSWWFNR